MTGRLRLGIVGAGMIATVDYGYLPGLAKITDRVEVVAITSRTRAAADRIARDWNIALVYDDLPGMLADASLDAVLNLTPIAAHFDTSMQILSAGKHLVSEKPLGATVAEADELCELAARLGLLIVCAPADMLSSDWQEAARLVRSGAIGTVAFARAQSSHGGPARLNWPADPSWFYQAGAGPLLDMGAYGIDRLTGLLGPARRVTALSGISQSPQFVRGGAFDGKRIDVTAPDTALLLLDFGDAVFGSVDASYNVVASKAAAAEVYGLEGSIVVGRPDAVVAPGQFGLEVFRLDAAPGMSGWITPKRLGQGHPLDRTKVLARASLVEHLADCLDSGLPPVASGERARHSVEIMLAAERSAAEGRVIELRTTFPALA